MDDFTVDVLNTVDRDTLPDQRDREDARSEPIVQAAAAVAGEQPSPRRWKGLAALRDRANVQDKLLEKYVLHGHAGVRINIHGHTFLNNL